MKKFVLLGSLMALALLGSNQSQAQTAGLVDGGTYKFTHHGVVDPTTGTPLCLDVDFDSQVAGASIGQWLDNGIDAQRFILELQTDGSYKIRHKNTQLYVQPVGGATAATTQIEQNVSTNDDTQRWIITDTGADGYKLILKATATAALPQALEVGFGSNVPGARVNLFDDNGFVPAQRWDLTLIPATPTGTRQASESVLKAEVFPNPAAAAQALKVQVTTISAGPATLELLDMLGRPVAQQAATLVAGPNTVALRTPTLAAGIYVVRVQQGGFVQQTRLVQK
ncbi:RICIN domain-containing protein [Hymenobacter sp. ASUV-10]|uniref:RICIN domain-containing protein n=1 Tax=Hymenobacter aranciens TaxID=3063996 RepID=A0ABT9B578_9BACT|nr:RICIN domain-containing protein [Hymenobacter sp. ASUV-10]MDO7873318.1 RICIN domain-containing protein [Hymenobacter sp. ASUV-10]